MKLKSIIKVIKGRMYCNICKNKEGFRIYRYRRGHVTKWYDKFTCVHCDSSEKRDSAGKILEQTGLEHYFRIHS